MSKIKQALFNFVPYPKTALAGWITRQIVTTNVCTTSRRHGEKEGKEEEKSEQCCGIYGRGMDRNYT